MSVRTAPCPGCGDTLTFRNAASLTVVCPSCGSLCFRSDVDLERLGKAAEVAPIESPLDLGASGKFEGEGWTAIGQVQYDHGAGPWNEWCLLLDRGGWAWLAEAQGELLWTKPVEDVDAPDRRAIVAGEDVDLGGAGTWTVAEIGEGRVTALRGEVPVKIVPGSVVRYADLQGKGGRFGTLDYGSGDTCEAVYLGRRVEGEEVGLDPTKVAAATERHAAATRLSCPSCGGEIERRDPTGSVRIVCGSCGALLDPSSKGARVLGVGAALAAKPRIPIGSAGVLRGSRVEVLAFLVRSVRAEGRRWPWSEYLLKSDRGHYLWLVESGGHWSLGAGVPIGDVKSAGISHFRGRAFRPFSKGNARVDHVQGEVYWEVEVGETVSTIDYVDPPFMLTIEKSGKEELATLSEFVPREEVGAAFSLPPEALGEPVGVGACEPNPWQGQVGLWWGAFFAMLVAGVILMGLVTQSAHGESSGETLVGLVALGLLLIPPIAATTQRSSFETRRWADSDFSWRPGGTSDDDDDDGGDGDEDGDVESGSDDEGGDSNT